MLISPHPTARLCGERRLSCDRHDADPKLADLLQIDELAPYRDDPSSWFTERDRIKALIADRIALSTVDEWLAVLEPADIWCARVLDWNELLESEGFLVLDMLQT